ncbi:MAG: FHA domain-containing protein [Phycisphaeraceae bacterium]|nr:FHA domain-containing protein [Phycisphaeraceae bacterium]
MASIIVVAGPNKGDYYPLGAKRNWSVGRLAQCSIQIVDDSVSREHCALELAESGQFLTVRDKESSHGTFLNGEKVEQPRQAKDGDQIAIGSSTLLFTTRDFPDRESALKDQHLKRWFGEDIRTTMQM